MPLPSLEPSPQTSEMVGYKITVISVFSANFCVLLVVVEQLFKGDVHSRMAIYFLYANKKFI